METRFRRNNGWNEKQLAHAAGIDTEEILEIEHEPQSEPIQKDRQKEKEVLAGLIGSLRVAK